MADQKAPQMQATLGLTGLTSNAMALIAPGAFLWLTFSIQATTGVAGQPSTAPAMWLGIFAALAALPGNRGRLRRDFQALSRHRLQLLLRGAGAALEGQGLQVCPHRQVHRRLGLAPLLLGLSRRDGGRHRHLRWLCRRLPLSQLHERSQPGPGLHGTGCGRLLILRRVDRVEGRRRFDRRQPGDQRRADLRADRLQRAGAWLSRQPSGGLARPSSTTRRRCPPTPISSLLPRTARRFATQAGTPCRCWTRPASQFPSPSTIRPRMRAATS